MRKEYLLLLPALLFLGCIGIGGGPSVGSEVGGTLITPFGPLSTHDAGGSDISWLGRYDGMIRGLYEKTNTDDCGSYSIHLVYHKGGDLLSGAKDYFLNKISEAGFEKVSESAASFSAPGMELLNGETYEFSKGDENLEISFILAKMNGKEHTFVEITYDYYGTCASAGSEEQQTTEEQLQEVTPVGDAANWDNEIKPVLQSVFGSATLTSSVSANGNVGLSYKISEITGEKVTSFGSALSNKGYTLISSESDETGYYLTFQKGNYFVGFDFYTDSNEVEITILGSS